MGVLGENNKMRYFSMFSGIGGFELGIKKASESLRRTKQEMEERTNNRNSIRGGTEKGKQGVFDCVGYSEVDKYACQIFERHFPRIKNYGDCTKITPELLPDFDLLCGGFPCQSFSIAGKRMGFEDTRGTLFFDIARIIKIKRPRFVFLENVKGLLNHDRGRTFATILATLDELGYNVEWEVLNSKYFGVPQNRERVFIVGHLRETSSRQIFPLGKIGEEIPGMEQRKEINRIGGMYGQATRWGVYDSDGVSPTITKAGGDGGGHIPMIKYAQKADREIARIYDPRGIAPTFHLKTGGWQEPKIAYSLDANYGKGISDIARCQRTQIAQASEVKAVLTPDRPDKRQNGRRFKEDGEPMFTLTGQDKHGVEIDRLYTMGEAKPGRKCLGAGRVPECGNAKKSIRCLTPTECERLQGFPDGWTEGISDTQRYKCLGNAVTVNVIQAITEKIIQVGILK